MVMLLKERIVVSNKIVHEWNRFHLPTHRLVVLWKNSIANDHKALRKRGQIPSINLLLPVRLLLLILIAKGYTVTRARLRQQSAVKVAMFICCYGITYASLFIFEQMYFDPGQVREEDVATDSRTALCMLSYVGALPLRVPRRIRPHHTPHRRLVHVHIL